MAFLPAGLGLASGVLAGLSLFGEPRPPVRPPPLRVNVYILPAPGYYGGGAPGYYGGGAPGYYGGGRGTKKEKKKKPHGKGNAGYQGVFGMPDVLAASGERRLCSQKLNLQSEEESDEEESESDESESDESESESDSEEEDESDDEETVHQPAGRAYY